MAQGDHVDGSTVSPLHATWTILPDGTANSSIGVAFTVVRPSGRAERLDVEVPLEDGEADKPWSEVTAAVFQRAMAREGLTALTPPAPEPSAEEQAALAQARTTGTTPDEPGAAELAATQPAADPAASTLVGTQPADAVPSA